MQYKKKSEAEVLNLVLKELGKLPEFRVWRVQVGTFYGVAVIRQKIKLAIALILSGKYRLALAELKKNVQAAKIGIEGQSDVAGIHKSGRSIWIEVKAEGNLSGESPEQKKWGAMIRRYNGFYMCVDRIDTLFSALRFEGLLSE